MEGSNERNFLWWIMVVGGPIALIILLVVLIRYYVEVFNRLVPLKNSTSAAGGKYGIQLTNRNELVPVMRDSCFRLILDEQRAQIMLAAVQKARNPLGFEPIRPKKRELPSATLERVMPQLTFIALNEAMVQLMPRSGQEVPGRLLDMINAAQTLVRQAHEAFNDRARDYNDYREAFPGRIVVWLTGEEFPVIPMAPTPDRVEEFKMEVKESEPLPYFLLFGNNKGQDENKEEG